MRSKLLKELCFDDRYGVYGIPATAEEFDESKTRYLRITDISETGELLHENKKSVSSKDLRKYLLEEGDIVFARTGNSTGKTYFHEAKNGDLAFAGFLIKFSLNPQKVNPKYLRYYTITKHYKQWVENFSLGSTRGNINAESFANCPIPLPERTQQDFLVKVLSDIDSKIELNNKINAELESMAKLIYDYWFVQFDFPDENGKPYKTYDGKMVYNKELKREIPEGWEVKDLKTLLDYNSGHSFSSKSYCDSGKWKIVTIKSVQESGFDTSKCDRLISIPQNLDDECNLEIGDLLMSLTGNTGRLCFVTESNCLLNQRVAKIWSSELSNYFIYLYFKRPEKQKLIEQLSSGSSQANLSPLQLLKTKDIIPKKNILKLFEGKIEPIFQRILVNEKENQKLSELRDWLLPMLMNGQVKVK